MLQLFELAITLWLSLKECNKLELKDERILVLSNNTSMITWIFKTSLPKSSVYFEAITFITRRLAELILKLENFVVTQYIPGVKNVIADWLSFDGIDWKDNEGKPKLNPISIKKTIS